MKPITSLYIAVCLFLFGCNQEPTLQKYFVEKQESSDFLVVDMPASIFNLAEDKLTKEQKDAVKSFNKMNILAFKKNDKNEIAFETEKQKVKSILKNETYNELMKFNAKDNNGAIYFVGEDDNIEEFVLYGNQNETGFTVVRVLGKNMNPNQIITLLGAMQNANIDKEQLKPLEAFLKK